MHLGLKNRSILLQNKAFIDKMLISSIGGQCLTFLGLLFFSATPIFSQPTCQLKNQAFSFGEKLTYELSYNWGAIWLNAGQSHFNILDGEIFNKKVFHFQSQGYTYPNYDWIYKVNDTYEAYSDTATLRPYRFVRDVNEGSNDYRSEYLFHHPKSEAYSIYKSKNEPVIFDTIRTTPCTYDVLSIIYYTRCIDYTLYEPEDTIPISIILDKEIHNIYIRYLGKDTITTAEFGTVPCIQFKPLLVEGTIFKGGEKMKVWVTDDENKIPILIQTPILVGSIKIRLSEFSGLRNKTILTRIPHD